MTAPDTAVLRVAGRPVGRYIARPELPARLSPRPYLHPVTTLAGTAVTELTPADHLHHLGVGVAVPDVEGFNFWGGRTYVRDQGPTELDNHGVQRHTGFQLRDPDGFVEELRWTTATTELLRERRTVAATELTDTAWALDFTFSLTNPGPAPLSIGSPATNGRPGAAYGGFFWRARKESSPPDVFTASTEGEAEVHGTRADWLALAGADWTLVFAGATGLTRRDPWFVRTAEYPGVGSSLASAERLPVPPGETVVRRVVTVVADGRLGRDEATALVRKAVSQ
ncbi:PmoA family protein [Streptomyces acidiscabies]|uniref:PmoA family protein n=1 Tax=Streptomyces acidiscabies TaxID=42234 RepID=A0AAP6B653_9ACTN|nr:PmoA family protein [Streptomyces acidiscabies]MBP5940423.1 oxidoreductase [Streptomyces sp. LBUM 1476]MBZ3911663.1 PmoA family protein [Streptomyces acidiscabies]MDX2958888.1 PmoA family protein [Streptomyces acidiscabies]MDX3018325.1 PmoA family protein [Streptomyces acidiscabies]MDX3794722.1 PmoA family protein [Streptomyces acidiscabies]